MTQHSSAYYTRQATYKKLKEAHQPPLPPTGERVRQITKETVGYKSLFGSPTLVYEINVPLKSLQKFGGIVELKLVDIAADSTDTIIRAPRGFQPSKIKLALLNIAAPARKVATVTERPYLNYSLKVAGEQSTFSCAIGSTDNTAASLQINFNRVAATFKTVASRVSLVIEKSPESITHI